MSELDLPALADDTTTQTLTTPIKEIDAALKACTFGRFHYKLMFAAFTGIITGVLVSSTTGYLLPVAECDLEMTLVEKGILNGMPYIGMMFSSVIAGFLTDAYGRKIFLVIGNAGIFISNLIAGSSQTYEVLVIAKCLEGMLFAACFSALVTLSSEYCHNGIRDRVMICQSSFASICQVVIALMSWGILTNDWKVSFLQGKFVLNTWNFYLYAMSLWSLAACIMYAFFVPESPKYLVTQKKYDEAREILIKVYVQNTGKPADTYPYINIWKDKSKYVLEEEPETLVKKTFSHQMVVALHNVKPMFQKPLVIYLALICTMTCAIMSMYNVYRLWFPQLSAIVENYQTESDQNLCSMLEAYTESLKLKLLDNTTQDEVCVPKRSGTATYINICIIGCVSVLPYFITGVLVNKVGKKWLLIASGLICTAASIILPWANSVAAIVTLFSITIAVSQVMLSLNQALTVEVFGTTTRTLAISLMMVIGRMGAITGNVAFPILLDIACDIPFFALAGIMAFVTIVSLFIPSKK